MVLKDWIKIDGNRYSKQAVYTNKKGAKLDAKKRRSKGQKVRILKKTNKYVIYVKK